IVDSSKHPVYLRLLAGNPELDVRLVHLIRDPRAVAFSMQRVRANPGKHNVEMMPRFTPRETALLWLLWNAATMAVSRSMSVPRICIRYEDLVANPAGAVSQIKEFAGIGAAGGSTSVLSSVHMVSGNPMRFEQAVNVRRDDE